MPRTTRTRAVDAATSASNAGNADHMAWFMALRLPGRSMVSVAIRSSISSRSSSTREP